MLCNTRHRIVLKYQNSEFPGGLAVEDPALSLLWLGFNPGPGIYMCQGCSQINKIKYQSRLYFHPKQEYSIFLRLFLFSEELQDALGVTDKSLPPFIYRMRQLGYPPGWLKEAELENSGLALYDGKGTVCSVK